MAATLIVDAFGTPIALNATVKLVGVVSAINSFDNRFNEITITVLHPVSGVPDVLVSPGGNITSGQQLNATKSISVSPTMLVVGS